ncbi:MULTISPECIES: sigma-54-dependent Fis family transcriptional regulator [unclassified Gordonia (in: high G+C Gram-positive bacteria)]
MSREVARARERFLSDDDLDAAVREAISTSWRRSRSFNVDADRLQLPFVREPNLESPLVSAARPVLSALVDDLADDAVSVILTSPDGVVLSRASANRRLRSMLDDVNLAPGYSYSEEFAGTNGIGTALETRKPTLVAGAEHYAGCLDQLSCAGVPIIHPVSGAMVGALDLTGWDDESGSLLMSLAKSATAQIVQRMMSQASERESRLLNAYLATCRRAPQAMVLAIAGDVVLMNRRLRLSVDPRDQLAILEQAVDHSLVATAAQRVNALPSGQVARLSPVAEFSDAAAQIAVFRVHLLDTAPAPAAAARPARATLPGVAGHSSSWRLACEQISRAVGAGEWLAVSGEPGTGRSTVLRACCDRHVRSTTRVFAADDFTAEETLDTLATELERDGFCIIITDLDRVPDEAVAAIADMLPGREHAGWIGVTTGVDAGSAPSTMVQSTVMPFFAHTVEIPPLRHRIEDLHDLIPALLRQLTRGRELSVSAEAITQLSRYPWPGNVAELRQILREVVTHQRSGVIGVRQLPPRCRALTRHTLTRIEALERDAIVRSLEENAHSKAAAAHALGISRATIYRKIREFGIDT